jgi:glycosyltransferase involved in cell wall biosynthesis
MTSRVLHVFGTMNRGGAEMRTVSLMRGMTEKHIYFDYCVLSGDKGVLDDQIRELGGEIFYCNLGPTFIVRFICLLLKRDFNAVHSHVAYVSGFILLLAKLSGIKRRIAHFRNTTAGNSLSLVRSCRDKFLKFLIKVCATDILAVCDGAMVGFWGEHWQQEKRCKVIYNGFELVDKQVEPTFWSNFIPSYYNQKIIVNVARMDVQKNHLRQCDIFQALHERDSNTLMVFIGKENPERKAMIISKVMQYGLQEKVVFLGLQTDVLRFLKHSDVMLFPSEWEGLPGVVLEAASVGLPVVASDLPGVREIADQIPYINIVNLQVSDIAWAANIYDVLMQSDDPYTMIEAFKKSDFLIDNNIEQLHEIYSR